MGFHSTYAEARAAGQRLANAYDKDVGLEVADNPLDGRGFRVWLLPLAKNRFGHEARCEVITPDVWPSAEARVSSMEETVQTSPYRRVSHGNLKVLGSLGPIYFRYFHAGAEVNREEFLTFMRDTQKGPKSESR